MTRPAAHLKLAPTLLMGLLACPGLATAAPAPPATAPPPAPPALPPPGPPPWPPPPSGTTT